MPGDGPLINLLVNRVVPQSSGPTIGPQQTGPLATIRNALFNFQNDMAQQPVVKVLQSPLGSLVASAALPPGDEPMPVGPVFKKALDGALDDYYGLPAGAPPSVRAPKSNAIRNIYDQIVALGEARPQSELAKVNQDVQSAKQLWRNSSGGTPNPVEVAPTDFRAQTILGHLQKSGYNSQPDDLQTLQNTIRNVQQFSPPPSIEGQRTGTADRRLGEVARQVAGLLPNNSPLKKAIRGATGWAQYDQTGGLDSRVSGLPPTVAVAPSFKSPDDVVERMLAKQQALRNGSQ